MNNRGFTFKANIPNDKKIGFTSKQFYGSLQLNGGDTREELQRKLMQAIYEEYPDLDFVVKPPDIYKPVRYDF